MFVIASAEGYLATDIAHAQTQTELALAAANVDVVVIVARDVGREGTGGRNFLVGAVRHIGIKITHGRAE